MIESYDVWERYDNMNGTGLQLSPMLNLLLISVAIVVVIVIVIVFRKRRRKLSPEDRILTADAIDEMPIDDFIDVTDEQYQQANDNGCYILYNIDKEKYYVGKSSLCADAVSRELIGKGSPDVFYEKKSGDDFTVQFYFVVDGSAYVEADSLYEDIISVYGENSEVIGL